MDETLVAPDEPGMLAQPAASATEVMEVSREQATQLASQDGLAQASWPAAAPSVATLQDVLVQLLARPSESVPLPPRVVEETWKALGRAEHAALRLVAGVDASQGRETEAAAEDAEVLCGAAARVLLARLHLDTADRPGSAVSADALTGLLAEMDEGQRAIAQLVGRVMKHDPALLRSYSQVSLVLQQHRTALDNVARRLKGEPERTMPGAGLIDEPQPALSTRRVMARPTTVGRVLVHEEAPSPLRGGLSRQRLALAALGLVLSTALLVHLFVLDTFDLFGPGSAEGPSGVPGVVRVERRAEGTRVVVGASFNPAGGVEALQLGAQPTTFVDEQGFPVATMVNGKLMEIPHPMGARAGGVGHD